MKVVQKIVAASICWTSLVLILESYQRLQREISLLEGDLIKECELVGTLIKRDVSTVWSTQGILPVTTKIEHLNAELTPITLRPVDFSATAKPSLTPRFARDDIQTARQLGVPLHDTSPSTPTLVTYTWLPEVGPDQAIEMSVSLEQKAHFIERAVFDLCVMLLIIILIAVGFSTWAGWFVIGKRITSMISVTRDAAQGTHRPLEMSSFKDEISELMQELNAMNIALEQSNAHVQDERARREALTTQLLHTDRLATTGVLLSQVAHEIGTPLAVIRGRLQRTKKRIDTEHDVQRELRIATEQVDRIQHIIRGMLDFSRNQSDVASCPTHELLAKAIELVEMLANRHRVTFKLLVQDQGHFHGDRLAMEQAFINVLLNALHVSKQGDVITVAQHHTHDELERPITRITISDQGPGIDADLADQIFDPFFTTKPTGQGTGMGLMIASTVVKAHQGSLRLDDTFTQGARFIFDLPDSSSPHKLK